MRVYGLTKKVGLLLLFDSCYNVKSNNIDVINHIDRYVDYIHMYDISDNFLSHPKTRPVTSYMWASRVANSLRHLLASSY